METPRIDGLRVKLTVGSGVSGTVYSAEDESGTPLAVKVYQGMSINRQLLAKATQRLEHGDWPKGVMPIISAAFDGRPALRVTLAYTDDDGQPSSLQHRLASYPAVNSWELVRELAGALAAMHNRQVAHANLKPGNIFFAESGELLLTDWAVGQVPGISHLEYTDAFLYQSPEQLLHPEGYLDEAAYRWDVFSYAVLSFRLLTGKFPRCDDTFSQVAPAPGETRREGVIADTQKIARGLELQTHFNWPDEPQNAREAQYRELLNRCLALDPLERPATMAAVLHSFEEIDQRNDSEEHRDLLLDQRRRADKRSWMWTVAAGIFLGIGILLGSLWITTSQSLRHERKDRVIAHAGLIAERDDAVIAKKQAENTKKSAVDAAIGERELARETLRSERAMWLARVESARDTGDHLFAWALEKGNRSLPPLDGRELRLKRLETYYQEFMEKNAAIPELEDERARAMLQLAEISLALGKPDIAAKRMQEALTAWEKLEKNADWTMRIATDQLLLALLWQNMSDPRSSEAFVAARSGLVQLQKEGGDTDRVKQLAAILDYHEAKNLSESKQDAKALEQLMSATKKLNELADSRPDAMVLRSELANCYLSSATILEGMGQMGDARETRVLAVNELVAQLKVKPNDFTLRMDLAGAYGSMAEASVLAGDIASGEQLSKDAVALLEKLIREQPENAEVASRLAAQRGLTAGMMEDRGDSKKAAELVDDGISILVSHVAAEKGDALAKFRLAMLFWQKGRITGAANDRKQELVFFQQALDLFLKLADKDRGNLRAEQVKRSMGYLFGDMGHSAQIAKDKATAKQFFAESVKIWQDLLKLRPKNEEYEEGLNWSQGRFKDL